MIRMTLLSPRPPTEEPNPMRCHLKSPLINFTRRRFRAVRTRIVVLVSLASRRSQGLLNKKELGVKKWRNMYTHTHGVASHSGAARSTTACSKRARENAISGHQRRSTDPLSPSQLCATCAASQQAVQQTAVYTSPPAQSRLKLPSSVSCIERPEVCVCACVRFSVFLPTGEWLLLGSTTIRALYFHSIAPRKSQPTNKHVDLPVVAFRLPTRADKTPPKTKAGNSSWLLSTRDGPE